MPQQAANDCAGQGKTGLVGAGGIGLQLDASINPLAWSQVWLILLVILVTVIVSEWVSAKVRHALSVLA